MNHFHYLNKLDLILENTTFTDKKSLKTNENICNFCDEISIIYDYTKSNILCKLCGYVQDGIVEGNAEWRYYKMDYTKDNPSRCGQIIDPLLPKSSLGTKIGGKNCRFNSILRLHQWNQMPADERSLFEVFKQITQITNKFLSKKITEEVKLYYKLLSEKTIYGGNLTRGTTRLSLISACIMVACKNSGNPMRKIEISRMCNINKKDVTKGEKKFAELEKNNNLNLNNFGDNIVEIINRYVNYFNFPKNYIDLTHMLMVRISKINITQNSNNYSICAGLMFFIIKEYNLNIKKNNLINKINISEVTLNKIYKLINNYRSILLIGFEHIEFLKKIKN